MKKIILSAALALVFTMSANAQILYRISGNGIQQPSYILGSHHLVSAGFADKVPGLKAAQAATTQICGEVVTSNMLNPDSLKALQEQMMLPEGKTVKDVLSAEQYQRLDAFLTKTFMVGLSNPQLAPLTRFTPGALSTQIIGLLYMVKHPGEFDPTNPFDAALQKQAISEGKKAIGLETVGEQMRILYGKTMERQVQGLMCLVDNGDWNVNMMENLTKAYQQMDSTAIVTSINEKLNNECDNPPAEDEALIYGRNARWAKLMPQIMATAPTLFVVGSAHLFGAKGVLALLRQQGYRVEGVQEK